MRLLFFFLLLLAGFSVCSAQNQNDSLKNLKINGSAASDKNELSTFDLQINTLNPDDLFFLRENSFSLNLNIPVSINAGNGNSYNSLYFSQPLSFNAFQENKARMSGTLYNIYSQNKPGKMQQILGMVQLSGAAVLAGYHIYKYYIKEKK
ncbi:MAG: hypothetical protein ACM3Q2_04705 [Syntrophothermus sp.]